jgi:hypothetical protein
VREEDIATGGHQAVAFAGLLDSQLARGAFAAASTQRSRKLLVMDDHGAAQRLGDRWRPSSESLKQKSAAPMRQASMQQGISVSRLLLIKIMEVVISEGHEFCRSCVFTQ